MMRLLVSVRMAAEVAPALAGGADILDAKEPGRGPLGAVAPDTLAQIFDQVPPQYPCSVALGDVTDPDEVLPLIPASRLLKRPSPVFLKLGFAGVRSPEMVSKVIERLIANVARQPSVRVVAVAYADAERAGTLDPTLMLEIAHRAGAHGVLMDTHTKDGLGLFGCFATGALANWVTAGRRLGLVTALAGELQASDLGAVSQVRPDVIGVRGAACEGGRAGVVSVQRVRGLRQRLGSGSPGHPGVGETRDGGAILPVWSGRKSLKVNA
jgi:(5-formylfuran-3-yl)methyl phosphate synthase